jgi:hypothetical protein
VGEKGKISFGFRLFLLLVEAIILVAILGGAWLMDKLLIAPPLIVAFRLTRVKIEKKYAVLHLATISACMCASTAICWFGTYISLPQSLSLISNIMVGVIFAIATWKIQEFIDLKHKYGEKEELIHKCRSLNYNPLNTEIAVKFFYEHQKPKDVWLWLCETQENPISWDSVKNLKYKMKNDLF